MSTNLNKRERIEEPISEEILLNQDNLLNLLRSIPKSQTNAQKIFIISQIQDYINQLQERNLEIKLNTYHFNELLVQINDCKTIIQKELLNVTRLIAQLGSDITSQFHRNQFFDIFDESGLISKIQKLLSQNVKKDEKSKKGINYSEITLFLAQTLTLIFKHQNQQKEICSQCGKVLIQSIQNLISNLKQYKQDNKENEIIQGNNDKFNNNIIRKGINSLHALQSINDFNYNYRYYISEFQIYKFLSTLFHINCPQKLHCSQRLFIPYTNAYEELQGAALCLMNNFMGHRQSSKYLYNNSFSVEHISNILLLFAKQYSDEQHQQFSVSAHKMEIIKSVIGIIKQNFTHQVIDEYNLSFNSQFITSLITLSKYQKRINDNKYAYVLQAQIRLNSYNFWGEFFSYFYYEDIQENLKKQTELIKILINGLQCAGGNEEENHYVIENNLSSICFIFTCMNDDALIIQPYIDLKKNIEQIIENEGIIEEIDSNEYWMINEDDQYDYIKLRSYEAKKYINNANKDVTNLNENDLD